MELASIKLLLFTTKTNRMKLAKINVNRGSSFFKFNGQSFLVKEEFSGFCYLLIKGHTVSFNQSEITLREVSELNFLDEIEKEIDLLYTDAEKRKIAALNLIDRFRGYYQESSKGFKFPDLNKRCRFYSFSKTLSFIKKLNILVTNESLK